MSANHETTERQALARCRECFDDGQDTDVGRAMLDRLTALGWLNRLGRAQWEISREGQAIVAQMVLANE